MATERAHQSALLYSGSRMRRTGAMQLPSLLVAALIVLIVTGCDVSPGRVQATLNPPATPAPSPTPTPFPMPQPFPTPTPPSPTPTPTPAPTPALTPAPTAASRFIFGTPGFESGSIQAGVINSNGSVSAVAGSPFDEGLGTPSIIQVTADPKGRFVYVLNVNSSAAGQMIGNPGIGEFAVNRATGALSRVPGSPIVFPANNDNLMAVDGTGRFLFEPNGFAGSPGTGFDVYLIDQSTGALTLTSSTSNGAPVGSFTVASADGRFLFNSGNGLVEVFSIDTASGQLVVVPGTPTSTAGSAGPMATTGDGRFLYIANQNQGTVAVFSVADNGALSLVTGSPFAVDSGVQFLALTPDGKFLFVAAGTTAPGGGLMATVKGFAVNPAIGTFTPIALAVVNNVTSVSIDLSGRFAFISNVGNLFTFSIDPATGALIQLAHTTAPTSDDANDVITAP
jgi:6-phosphogluconolactonase (cycloisomerase 2 family)